MSDLSKTEPTNPSDAIKHSAWKEAMAEEYQSIMKNDVWEIVPDLKENLLFLPSGYLKQSMLLTVVLRSIKPNL